MLLLLRLLLLLLSFVLGRARDAAPSRLPLQRHRYTLRLRPPSSPLPFRCLPAYQKEDEGERGSLETDKPEKTTRKAQDPHWGGASDGARDGGRVKRGLTVLKAVQFVNERTSDGAGTVAANSLRRLASPTHTGLRLPFSAKDALRDRGCSPHRGPCGGTVFHSSCATAAVPAASLPIAIYTVTTTTEECTASIAGSLPPPLISLTALLYLCVGTSLLTYKLTCAATRLPLPPRGFSSQQHCCPLSFALFGLHWISVPPLSPTPSPVPSILFSSWAHTHTDTHTRTCATQRRQRRRRTPPVPYLIDLAFLVFTPAAAATSREAEGLLELY